MDPSARFRAAVDALSRNDVRTARHHADALLEAQPKHPSLLQLAGVIAAQSNDPKAGAAYFRRAIANGGDTADNRLNLAKALHASGHSDEALRMCDDPANVSPDFARLRAEISAAAGSSYAAVTAYERLTEANPDDADAWNNLGNALHASSDFDGALRALERARSLDPRSALVHLNLGRLLISLERYDEARALFEQAAQLDPKDARPLFDLGRALTASDRTADALPYLGSAARLDPKDPQIFVAIGLAFTDLAERAKAEQAYRVALQVAPDHAAAYLNLGFLLEQDNRIDELAALVAQAEANGLAGDDLAYLRAILLGRQGQLEEALALAKGVQSSAIDPAIVAHFAGQIADRLFRIPEAYHAFEEMNAAAARSPLGAKADRTAYQRDIERLTDITTPEWFARWPRVAVPTKPPAPAFLVGFPRSGTTLLDTVLLGHSRVHVLEELPILEAAAASAGLTENIENLDAHAVAAIRALYFEELQRVAPSPLGALVIDKNPLSMLRVPLIHRLFPDAKIILAMRHPIDVVLSCWMQNFKPTEAMASFFDLPNAGRTYDVIFKYWERCRAIFPLDVHTIRYEDMIADTQASIAPLLSFLGLEWEGGVLDHQRTALARGHIRTPSYAQVTEGMYGRASGRWTRYRDYLGEVVPILAPWCERYGYSLD